MTNGLKFYIQGKGKDGVYKYEVTMEDFVEILIRHTKMEEDFITMDDCDDLENEFLTRLTKAVTNTVGVSVNGVRFIVTSGTYRSCGVLRIILQHLHEEISFSDYLEDTDDYFENDRYEVDWDAIIKARKEDVLWKE